MAREALNAWEAARLVEEERGVALTRQRLLTLARRGVLPEGAVILRLGRHVRFRRSGLLAWLDAGGAGLPRGRSTVGVA